MERLLQVRKRIKSKKPTFMRTDYNRYTFKNKWRKPRGLHNKRRLNIKGHQKTPSQGYRSPLEVRNLNMHGFKTVIVSTIKDLERIDPKTEMAVLSSKLGAKKKVALINASKSLNIKFENMKHPDKFVSSVNEKLSSKKVQSKKVQEKKEKTKQESLKKAEQKAQESNKETQEKVKESVLESKIEEKTHIKQEVSPVKEDKKGGHKQSSVPGTKE